MPDVVLAASGHPMDRLICGDVGFGKTEVALRGAFAAAINGTQVAVVVPTTLLARQHYKSFAQRFAGPPVRVAQMSRMVSAAELKQTRAGVADGTVDIVVNNAGIQHVANIEDFPVDKWDAVIAINLTSAFHTTRLALPRAVVTRSRRDHARAGPGRLPTRRDHRRGGRVRRCRLRPGPRRTAGPGTGPGTGTGTGTGASHRPCRRLHGG